MSRGLEEEYLERVRAYRKTEPYRKALRKRAVCVEPLFGEAKEWHGSRRFRLRGLEKVNAEALMIASGQNLKRLSTLGFPAPEEEGECGGPASTRKAVPTPTPPTPHDQSMAFFNRLNPSTHSGE